MNKVTQLVAEVQTVLQELESLTDEEMQVGLNFPIVLNDNFSPEALRDNSLRQEMAHAILASRTVTLEKHQTVEWPKTTAFKDLTVIKQTICLHVDV